MASTYIYRTNASAATLGTKATYSLWLKRGNISDHDAYGGICGGWSNASGTGTDNFQIGFTDTDTITVYSNASAAFEVNTNAKFRDVAAWYHIVVSLDTTQVTPADRLKTYVNGVQQTYTSSSYPTQDTVLSCNKDGQTQHIGQFKNTAGSIFWFDGEMSWVQFVDGLALAATDFGSFDATSGIWKIKPGAYATPGTNGFTLAMEDRSNLDLDTSSNAHTFTTSGNLTATYDNPSNNFATLNPLDNYWPAATFTQGNNTVAQGTSVYAPNLSTFGMSAGKWYWEIKCIDVSGGTDHQIGISSTQAIAANQELGNFDNGWAYYAYNGQSRNENTGTAYGDTYAVDDIMAVALDLTNNKLYFAKNNTWQNSGVPTSGATGTGALSITAVDSTPLGAYFAGVSYWGAFGTFSMNFGNGYFGTTAVTSAEADGDGIGAFEYAPPTGYFALCTKNIKAYGG